MPKVTVEQTHALSQDEVKKRLDAMNERLSAKFGLDARWTSDTQATFKQTGASGSIHCAPGRVVVMVDLSFALTLMKSRIEIRIRDELGKALA